MNSLIKRLLPWYKEEEEEVIDARAEIVLLKAQKVEANVRRLSESYRAEGPVIRKIKQTKEVPVSGR